MNPRKVVEMDGTSKCALRKLQREDRWRLEVGGSSAVLIESIDPDLAEGSNDQMVIVEEDIRHRKTEAATLSRVAVINGQQRLKKWIWLQGPHSHSPIIDHRFANSTLQPHVGSVDVHRTAAKQLSPERSEQEFLSRAHTPLRSTGQRQQGGASRSQWREDASST